MIFGEVWVDEAEGLILAHSLRLPDRMLKKGRVLNAGDRTALKAAGLSRVVGARLEPGDLGEDEAAARIAQAVAGKGLSRGRAFTGRCNLFATARGLAVVDRARLDALNAIDEAVTVATLPPGEQVEARQMAATVKIIPFAVSSAVIETCEAVSAGGPMLRVASYRPQTIGLILTRQPGSRQAILDETATITRARVAALGSVMVSEQICAHNEGAVERALVKALAAGCSLVLIAGASATVDRRDVVPAAIRLARALRWSAWRQFGRSGSKAVSAALRSTSASSRRSAL
ncbi:MAG: hypothetical protein K2Q10_11720, partial [Rhodospirillales bacterium]|nr:hypothetical protein [Rhodospirillales bacterium]